LIQFLKRPCIRTTEPALIFADDHRSSAPTFIREFSFRIDPSDMIWWGFKIRNYRDPKEIGALWPNWKPIQKSLGSEYFARIDQTRGLITR
jgi:hypothetical protein